MVAEKEGIFILQQASATLHTWHSIQNALMLFPNNNYVIVCLVANNILYVLSGFECSHSGMSVSWGEMAASQESTLDATRLPDSTDA